MDGQGCVGVVADGGKICLIGVGRLHLNGTEPFDDFKTVEDAQLLVNCGVSSLSHVPSMQMLLQLRNELEALPQGGVWDSVWGDHVLVAKKGPHLHTFDTMQQLVGALLPRSTVCVYIPHQPYKGWVAGSHGIMRPLWAVTEEVGGALKHEPPTAAVSTLCAIADDTDLQAQLDACQQIITRIFQICDTQTQDVYIDTGLLSLAILDSGHALQQEWSALSGDTSGKWVFLRLCGHRMVVVCLYEYHKTVLDLLALRPPAGCMDEHVAFLLHRASVLQLCHHRKPSDQHTGVVTIGTPTHQRAWEWSAGFIVDQDRDKPLTWGYLADELHVVHVAHTQWGDVLVRNPDGLYRWGSGLHSPVVLSAFLVGDHWYDVRRAATDSVFVTLWHTQQRRARKYNTPQKLKASFSRWLTNSNHAPTNTIEQLAYFLEQPILCICHVSSRLACVCYNRAAEQKPIVLYLCCAMLCHEARKGSDVFVSPALSAAYNV